MKVFLVNLVRLLKIEHSCDDNQMIRLYLQSLRKLSLPLQGEVDNIGKIILFIPHSLIIRLYFSLR